MHWCGELQGSLVRGIDMHQCGGKRYAEFEMVLVSELGCGSMITSVEL
jgi:hypothetical protein